MLSDALSFPQRALDWTVFSCKNRPVLSSSSSNQERMFMEH